MSKNDKQLQSNADAAASRSRCVQKVLANRRRFIDDCVQVRSARMNAEKQKSRRFPALRSHREGVSGSIDCQTKIPPLEFAIRDEEPEFN
jgi:hypothetical protein